MSQASDKLLTKLEEMIKTLLHDPSEGVRKNGQHSLKLYSGLYPKRGDALL
jgi:hypothetical protein